MTLVIMASEVGVLPVDPKNVARKWRLQPGKIFLIDQKKGRIVNDEEIKHELVNKRPWRQWLDENLVDLDSLPTPQNESMRPTTIRCSCGSMRLDIRWKTCAS